MGFGELGSIARLFKGFVEGIQNNSRLVLKCYASLAIKYLKIVFCDYSNGVNVLPVRYISPQTITINLTINYSNGYTVYLIGIIQFRYVYL